MSEKLNIESAPCTGSVDSALEPAPPKVSVTFNEAVTNAEVWVTRPDHPSGPTDPRTVREPATPSRLRHGMLPSETRALA